jgi:hypothetical protein
MQSLLLTTLGDPWPGTVRQWQLARHALGVQNDFDAAERLSQSVDRRVSSSLYNVGKNRLRGHEVCQAVYNGFLITYVHVYKANTNGLCANVWALAKRNGTFFSNSDRVPDRVLNRVPPPKRLTFSVVREPLGHFESAYSEIRARTKLPPAFDSERGLGLDCSQSWPRYKGRRRALAFVADFVAGRVFSSKHCGKQVTKDIHAVPQVALLTSALGFIPPGLEGRAFDRLLRLESLDSEWAELGRHIPDWPPFNATEWRVPWARRRTVKPHALSNAESNNVPRGHMRALLAQNHTVRLALCRVLLPDYVCLGYDLPPGCEPLRARHEVDCSVLRAEGEMTRSRAEAATQPRLRERAPRFDTWV